MKNKSLAALTLLALMITIGCTERKFRELKVAYNTEYMNRVKDRKAIEWTPNTITSNVTIEGNKERIELHSITPNLESYQMKEIAANPGRYWVERCFKRSSNRITKKYQ